MLHRLLINGDEILMYDVAIILRYLSKLISYCTSRLGERPSKKSRLKIFSKSLNQC